MTATNEALIHDDQSLRGAWTRHGSPIQAYDDGYGSLWVYRDSMGITGIVRAQTWDDAYEIVLDEFLKPIDQGEVHEAYGFDTPADFHAALEGGESDQVALVEGYHYQPNATGTGIVATDLNGEALDRLTPALADRLGMELDIINEEK